MNTIRQLVYRWIRNLYNIKLINDNKDIRCILGFHKIRRGFGWSRDGRIDICYRCDWKKWYEDKEGVKLLKLNNR